MFFVFGWSTKRRNAKTGEIIAHGCPTCHGDLKPMEYAKFFTLFFLPVFKISTVAQVYTCERCNKDYDHAHAQYFRKRGLIAGLSEVELDLFQEQFTMSIITAILTSSGNSQESKDRIVGQYIASQAGKETGMNTLYDEIKLLPYDQLVAEYVQYYYTVSKDNFKDGFQGRILWRALNFIQTHQVHLNDAGNNAVSAMLRQWGYKDEAELKALI